MNVLFVLMGMILGWFIDNVCLGQKNINAIIVFGITVIIVELIWKIRSL